MKKLMNLKMIKKYCTSLVDREEEEATKHGKKINRDRRLLKHTLKLRGEWETATAMPDPTLINITIQWKKSHMWGYNPYAEAKVTCKDGSYHYFKATASGFGYDKLSTVFASLLNQCMKGVLIRAYAKGVKMPYGTNSSNGIFPPGFAGGVGMSCYDGSNGVIAAIGGTIEHLASGDTFDAWRITYPAPRKRKAKGE